MFITYNTKTNKITIEPISTRAPEAISYMYTLNIDDFPNSRCSFHITTNIYVATFAAYSDENEITDNYAAFQNETDGLSQQLEINEFELNGYHVKTIKTPNIGFGYDTWVDVEDKNAYYKPVCK
jgi:hypothetical protein